MPALQEPGSEGPLHHIPPELLLDYASGALAEPWSLVVACHLTLCPQCRGDQAVLECTAATLLDEIVPAAGFEAIADRLGEQDATAALPAAAPPCWLPLPLQDYLPDGGIAWRKHGAGLQSCRLPMRNAGRGMLRLFRLAPGRRMPRHSHRGHEMTLVLSGGYTDAVGTYRRGDVELGDRSVAHRPVAMLDQPCICLAVTDAAFSIGDGFGWLLNLWDRLIA